MSVNFVLPFLNSVAISGFRDGIVNDFLHLCDRKLNKSTFSVTFPTELSPDTTEIIIMTMMTMIMMLMMMIMIMINIMIHLLNIFVLSI